MTKNKQPWTDSVYVLRAWLSCNRATIKQDRINNKGNQKLQQTTKEFESYTKSIFLDIEGIAQERQEVGKVFSTPQSSPTPQM